MRVLFVCTGNLYRSPVAEAMWRMLRPGDQVDSAGTSHNAEKGRRVPQRWREFAADHGIDLSEHRSQGLGNAPHGLNHSLIVGMQPSHMRTIGLLVEPLRRIEGMTLNLAAMIGRKKIPDPAFLYPGEWPGVWRALEESIARLAVGYEEVSSG